MSWTLAATAAGTALGATVYLSLALLLWHRPAEGGSRFATHAFALYWAFTGLYQAMSSAQHAFAAAGFAPFSAALVVRYAGLALASAGIASLLCYLVYLRTGSTKWKRAIIAAYFVTFVLTAFHIWRSRPIGVSLTAWSVDLAYADQVMGGLFFVSIAMLLLVPASAAVWYLTLVRKTEDPTQRYRIFAVGLGVSLQLFTFLVARLVESEAWQLISRVLMGIVVALLVWSAYRPHVSVATPVAA